MPAIGAALAAQLTFGGAVALGTGIALHASAFVALTALQKRQLSRDQGRVVMPPRDVMLRSTVEHRRIVYGEATVSGVLFWANSGHNPGSGIYDLYLAVVHCGHQIDSYVSFYLDDKFIPVADIEEFPGDDGEVSADTNSHGLGPVSTQPILWLRGHLGEDSQTADAFLTAAYSGIWTTDHRLRGNAYTVARLRQFEGTEDVWEGPPTSIQAKLKGKLVYDPRLDSTQAGGSGSHRVDDPTTWEYSTNPVLCTRDYMVDAKLGMGRRVAHTAFDYAHLAEQADICDALVNIPGSATQARYSCNGVLSCGSTHEENLTELYATMNGRPAYKNGKHYIYAGAWETPIATLTERHFAGDISYRKEPASKDRYNQVRGVYFDPERQDKRGEFLPVNDTAVRASRDKGVIPRDINLSLVNDEYQAQRLAFKLLYQDEDTGLCTIKCNMAALQFEVGDPIALTVARFGWVAKPFRIIGMTIPAYDVIELTLREYNESSFDDPDAGDYGERNESGIVSQPRVRRNIHSEIGQLVADPFFVRSAQLWQGVTDDPDNYHNYFWGLGDQTEANSSAEVVLGSGISGSGVLRMTSETGGTNTCHVISIPQSGQIGVAGEYVIVSVRLRRTTASLTNNSNNLISIAVGLGNAGSSPGNFGGPATFVLTHTEVAAWAQNTWQQFSFLQQLGLLSLSSFSGPYCVVDIRVQTDQETVTIEVDTVSIQRTADPAL